MELTSLIFSILALVISLMALPTVFQMYGGMPKISASWDVIPVEEHRGLRCLITNERIKNAFLKKLGVFRYPTDISANLYIYESGTNKLLYNLFNAVLSTESGHGARISLSPPYPARIVIAIARPDSCYLIKEDGTLSDSIGYGSYYAVIKVVANEKTHEFKRGFFIGDSPDEMRWDVG